MIASQAISAEGELRKKIARQPLAPAARSPNEPPPLRELCLTDDPSCTDSGGMAATLIWQHSVDPDRMKAELMEYSDWNAHISAVDLPASRGQLVRISRIVGSAYCVKDTYIVQQGGQYRLIDSASLDALSAEGGNCGDGKVMLTKSEGEPLLITDFYGVTKGYRFDPNFELREVFAVRYR